MLTSCIVNVLLTLIHPNEFGSVAKLPSLLSSLVSLLSGLVSLLSTLLSTAGGNGHRKRIKYLLVPSSTPVKIQWWAMSRELVSYGRGLSSTTMQALNSSGQYRERLFRPRRGGVGLTIKSPSSLVAMTTL